MNNIRFGFSWIGAVIFLLPMIINIVYAIFPPTNAEDTQKETNKIVEFIEQATRILYMAAIVFLITYDKINFKSPWMFLSILFLVLYYIVWLRYFICNRDVELLSKSFLFIPMPLAVFPVLYFIFVALWLDNYIALGIMIVFGIAHNIISYQSFA